jgi:hypothetical protein
MGTIGIRSASGTCAIGTSGRCCSRAICCNKTRNASILGGIAERRVTRAIPVLCALNAGITRRIARWLTAGTIAITGTFDANLCALVAHGFGAAAGGVTRGRGAAGGVIPAYAR